MRDNTFTIEKLVDQSKIKLEVNQLLNSLEKYDIELSGGFTKQVEQIPEELEKALQYKSRIASIMEISGNNESSIWFFDIEHKNDKYCVRLTLQEPKYTKIKQYNYLGKLQLWQGLDC